MFWGEVQKGRGKWFQCVCLRDPVYSVLYTGCVLGRVSSLRSTTSTWWSSGCGGSRRGGSRRRAGGGGRPGPGSGRTWGTTPSRGESAGPGDRVEHCRDPTEIDPFHAWKPPLDHKDTAKDKKCPLEGHFGCLEQCLYKIREQV